MHTYNNVCIHTIILIMSYEYYLKTHVYIYTIIHAYIQYCIHVYNNIDDEFRVLFENTLYIYKII